MNHSHGKLIVLNGPSSSGKSTLSKALQATLDAPFWHVSMDMFWFMLPPSRQDAQWYPQSGEDLMAAWQSTIELLVKRGINVIAEGGFLETQTLLDFISLFAGVETVFVGMFCTLNEIERREEIRPDRDVGYSRLQYDRFHRHGPYDIEINTNDLSPEEAAAKIKALLHCLPASSAFERIAAMQTNQQPVKYDG